MVDDVQYEFTSVQAFRGTEGKTIAKWGKDGWEVDSRDQGLLRTELTFRRVKPKTLGGTLLAAFRTLPPKMQLLAASAPVLLLVAVITIGTIAESRGGGSSPQPVASATDAEASAEPAQESVATSSAAPMTTGADDVLTVSNNAQLAALLASTSPSVAEVGAFAAQYRGRTIEFDGNVAFMNDQPGFSSRYDLLILAGDFSTTTSSGPNFQFRDVNLTSDLKLVGANVPATVGKGDNLRVVARVGDYNSTQELLLLEPVSIALREATPVAREAVAGQPSQAAAPQPAAAAPQAPASTYYANCAAARADGAAPVRAGDPGYSSRLDRDGDGVGCE